MTQIPKKLHYVWIGDSEKPEIFNKCLKSWQEKMPDYEIIEINKENFDLDDYITSYAPGKVVIIVVAIVAFAETKIKTKITIRHASHATYCYHENAIKPQRL